MKKYLDELQKMLPKQSDGEIARRLGVDKGTVSSWRSGRRAPSTQQARKLAQLLDRPELELVAAAEALRAATASDRDWWLQLGKTYGKAASLLLAACLISSGLQNESSAAENYATTSKKNPENKALISFSDMNSLYIMRLLV